VDDREGFSILAAQNLSTIWAAGQPHPAFMSLNRSKLTLDEQSFQDMLAAAYTIQEHNAKRKRTAKPEASCGKCGKAVTDGQSMCAICAAEEIRPGEKLQQKWATMWLMRQEPGLLDDSQAPEPAAARDDYSNPVIGTNEELSSGNDETSALPEDSSPLRIQEAVHAWPQESVALETGSGREVPSELNSWGEEFQTRQVMETQADASHPGGSDLRVKLRFYRADFYLVVAVIVSSFAMLWVLLASSPADARNRSRLRPWERAMISLGLADAPDPPTKHGNPNAQVWVDPKTALYYCSGDDQYGNTPGGRQTTQREAQLDSFQPAARIACD